MCRHTWNTHINSKTLNSHPHPHLRNIRWNELNDTRRREKKSTPCHRHTYSLMGMTALTHSHKNYIDASHTLSHELD